MGSDLVTTLPYNEGSSVVDISKGKGTMPKAYGLESFYFKFTFTHTTNPKTINLDVSFTPRGLQEYEANVKYTINFQEVQPNIFAGFAITSDLNTSPVKVDRSGNNISVYFGPNQVKDFLSLTFRDNLLEIYSITPRGLVPPTSGGTNLELPSPTAFPRINIKAFATYDGDNVCQLEYTVVRELSTSSNKEYCVDFASVIRNGCCYGNNTKNNSCCRNETLAEKINRLFEEGCLLDIDGFITYIFTRYVLSGVAFGCSNTIEFLRQKYNQRFLDWVENSGEFSNFYPLVNKPELARLFLQ
jgi:hypothetical protein